MLKWRINNTCYYRRFIFSFDNAFNKNNGSCFTCYLTYSQTEGHSRLSKPCKVNCDWSSDNHWRFFLMLEPNVLPITCQYFSRVNYILGVHCQFVQPRYRWNVLYRSHHSYWCLCIIKSAFELWLSYHKNMSTLTTTFGKCRLLQRCNPSIASTFNKDDGYVHTRHTHDGRAYSPVLRKPINCLTR